jgi:site-specific recombinase XerD
MSDERMVVSKIKSKNTLEFGHQIEKFRQRMVVNNFSEHTILSYIAAIKRLHEYYNRPLESLQEDNLVDFVCNLKENYGLSVSSMRIAVGAIKYFYRHILNLEALIGKIPYPKIEQHINTILTGSEVKRLLDLTLNLKHRLILKILYSAGLRRSEVMNLRCEDFDWKNMQLRVRQGKGKKDRLTVLARSLKSDYIAYIKDYAPEGNLFFGCNRSTPAYGNMLHRIMCEAVQRAGITKKVHLHTLRHSFASHLLSINTDIVTVQKLLGHVNIKTTMIYLHLSNNTNTAPRSPMDVIYK